MILQKRIIFILALIASSCYADDVSPSVVKFIQELPSHVLTKCNLTTLKCGIDKLKVIKQDSYERYDVKETYKHVAGKGIEIEFFIRENEPYFISTVTVTNRNFPMPLGLVVGESKQKVESLLGTFPNQVGECITYADKILSNVTFCFGATERITKIYWLTYVD